jgi:transketolase
VTWQTETERIADRIRRCVLDQTIKSNGGYLSQACSSAEILATLYTHLMTLGPSEGPMIPPPFTPGTAKTHGRTGGVYNGAKAPHLDRFIVSPTHYAMAVYAALVATGRMAAEGLEQFNLDGSSVEMIGEEFSPGHEVTGGSFGQAISQAAGIAVARRLRGDSGRVWVFMSDGEFQEGQVWEAFSIMAFHKIDNVAVFVDVNGQQVDGRMKDVMDIGSLAAKLMAFGAEVAEVNGHDVGALAQAGAKRPSDRPLVVLCHTEPYRGIALLKPRYPNLHYVRFSSDDERNLYRQALNQWQEN